MSLEAQDRSKRVLAALVREYIESGEPVASSLLVAAAGLGVSSATVRNILARLESEGFVQQPHTSAGRIPTDRGYRFYVDLHLDAKRTSRIVSAVEARLRKDQGDGLLDTLLPQVSHVISQASGHIGFAVRPANDAAVFDRVEFIPLGATRVLVVIVARGGNVIQKVIDVAEPLTADDLRHSANYLNAEFSGLPLHRAREAVLERLRHERTLYDALLARAMKLATSMFAEMPDGRAIYIDGAASLLEETHGLTLDALHTVLQLIEEKQRLVRLLNEYIDGPGLTIVIGAEHPDPHLRSFSLIASTYGEDGSTGTIGVIGPTRMRYPRAIDVVDGAARAVSRVLRDFN
ncbi:MAG TPA: heat-inducible transcriptional repressor HrcA [Vicinamibacterales bacterium]|nr:heat-inducible transcriptional repressor HrcA [Vicinamibacterales bacterium]